jgi:hypothetical protein
VDFPRVFAGTKKPPEVVFHIIEGKEKGPL